jgi:hypothetical protein
MNNFLKPLESYKNTPIELHIGSVENDPVLFIPVLFAVISDTKEANDIVGIRGAPNCKMRCRMCTSTDLLSTTYKDTFFRRNDDFVETWQRRGQHAWLNYVNGKVLTHGQLRSLQKTKDFCLFNGFNPLLKYTMHPLSIHLNLTAITLYDKLHTVLKGVLELCLRWSMAIIIAVSKIDKNYCNSIGKLDRKIKSFPVGHSITPFGPYVFHKGVSLLFNEGTNRNIKALDAVVGQGGRLEAQRISTLLWQVRMNKIIYSYLYIRHVY